jgi:hypothetical protein
MNPPRPDSDNYFQSPPEVPAWIMAAFAAHPHLSQDLFAPACLIGDRTTLNIAAWDLVQKGEFATRDALLGFAIEQVGFADVPLLSDIRREWGAIRPQIDWEPVRDWLDVGVTVRALAAAPTGTVATDLLAYCLYPVTKDVPFKTLWKAKQELRSQILGDLTKPLVVRLSAALASMDHVDPRWAYCMGAEDSAEQNMIDILLSQGAPQVLIDGLEYAQRDERSFPAVAHLLVHGEYGAPCGLPSNALDPILAQTAELIRACWLDPQFGEVGPPPVLGLPLAAFSWNSEPGKTAMQDALAQVPNVVKRLKSLSKADPVEIVDTVIGRATRRLATRDTKLQAFPYAPEMGDMGMFCRIGISPFEIVLVLNLVRPILPAIAKNLASRLVVLH